MQKFSTVFFLKVTNIRQILIINLFFIETLLPSSVQKTKNMYVVSCRKHVCRIMYPSVASILQPIGSHLQRY